MGALTVTWGLGRLGFTQPLAHPPMVRVKYRRFTSMGKLPM